MWRRRCRRDHGGRLTDPPGVLRPAVEAALETARRGLALDPPREPPAGLRRYLQFAKLSSPAVRAIAKIVDGDSEFRAVVATRVDEETVGRAGWLWLTRPQGWEDELAALISQAQADAEAEAEEREERTARRKLAAAQDAADRAAAEVQRLSGEVDRLRAELSGERSRRSAAEDAVDRLQSDLARLGDERDRAVRELEDVEAQLADRTAELNRRSERLQDNGGSPDGTGPEPAGAPWPDPVVLDEALGTAARDAHALGEALSALGALLRPGSVERHAAARSSEGPAGEGVGGESPAPGTPAPARRVPVKLPGGMLDDSVEAARHLLRIANVLVLVDGYNVTMTGWPDLPVAEQRSRLLSSLSGLSARTGADVEVIFDGAEVEPLSGPPPRRTRSVRVRFSAPDVEADDVLLDLLGSIPTARPVVVVSSDNRVRRGAHRLGANLLHARQLLEAASVGGSAR